MLIRYGYDITLTCLEPTPMICLLSTQPERTGDIRVEETLVTTPKIPVRAYFDSYGNVCRRFVAPQGDLSLWSDATITDTGTPDPADPDAMEHAVAGLPDECLLYLLGSRYCDTETLSQTAWDMFGNLQPGWSRVQAICDFVHGHISFDYERASPARTASDALREGVGVCRDYAHLAIALCRCMNIPARYVNGYLGDIGVPIVEPMDFSAWIEVYLGGQWRTFDPRNNARRIGRIMVARGRDAVDVPLIHSFKPHTLKSFRVWAYDVTNAPPTPAGEPGAA